METTGGKSAEGFPAVARDHLLYIAVVCVYCLPFILHRDLFFRDESRYGGVVKEMFASDSWFTLTNGGSFYSDKPPLFFDLVRLAGEVTGTIAPWIFFAVVAVTAVFFVAASDALLRSAGFDRRTVRAANLILLAVPWIAVHMQLVRMDLLFSGLILLSTASYVSGASRAGVNLRPLVGGLLAGLAVLVKGPFGALIPLLSVVAFLAATRRLKLLLRADLLGSLALVILPIALWFFDLYATLGSSVFAEIFGEQIVERALSGRDSSRAWWLYPLWIAFTLMPWLLLAPLLLIAKCRQLVFTDAWTRAQPGPRFVIPYLVVSIVLLGLVSQKNIHYLLPVVPGLMLLVAIAYLRLDAEVPRLVDWFFVALAAVSLIAPPAMLLALGYLPEKAEADLAAYVRPETLTHFVSVLTLSAIPLAIGARLRGEMRLIAGIAATAVMVIAVKAILIPDLDRVFSPRHTASLFEEIVPAGEPIVVLGVYRGALTYHFERPLIYVDTVEEMLKKIETVPQPAYVVITGREQARHADLWHGFTELAESRLETTRLILLGRPAPE